MKKKDKFGYIYKITNVVNGKIYIGKTEKTVETRFAEHLSNVKVGKKQSKLYSAMKHYGVENFTVEEIDTADDRDSLCEKEIFYIKAYNSQDDSIGYNVADGGNGGAIWSPKGYITVNNGIKNLQIPPNELNYYLNNGWVKGGHKIGKSTSRSTGKWIHKGDTQKRVYEYELNAYLKDGWLLGYSDKGKQNLSKSHKGKTPANKGIHRTLEQNLVTSITTKIAMNRPEVKAKMNNFYSKIKGSKWVSNEIKSLQVSPDDVSIYLENGYHLGRKKGGGTNE